VLAQELDRLLVAHGLGDRLDPQTPGDADDRADHVPVDLATGETLDELPVELDEAHRQVLEVVERPEAGPEVVDGQARAELVEPAGEAPRLGHVGDRRGLGDLKDEHRGIHRPLRERVLDHFEEVGVADDRISGDPAVVGVDEAEALRSAG
jgi:hypothetical protein